MTVTNTQRSVAYVGNGATTVFPFAFHIPNAASLKVVLAEIATGVLTEITAGNYSVTGLGNPSGGSVTYPLVGSPIASTHRIAIYREMPVTQEVVVSNQTAYYADVAMRVWDDHIMIMQELRDDTNRAVKVPIGSEGTAAELTAQLTADITNVSQNIAGINTVADGMANIGTVATNIADVNTVASNMAAITSASGSVVNMSAAAFTGDGTTVIFPLPAVTNAVENVLVWLDGVHINPTEDYTATTAAVTLAVAPANGVEVRILVISAVEMADVRAARDAAIAAAAAAEATVAGIVPADILYGTDNLNRLENVSTALTNLGVSAFVQTILNDANAAGVFNTLGISAFIQTLLNDPDAATARTTLGVAPALGFTPVQQGGGISQGINKIYIGWDTGGNGLRLTVDSSNQGFIARSNSAHSVMGEIAAQTGTATGTYILAYYYFASGSKELDTLVAGSALRIASVENYGASALPGTWRLMGRLSAAGKALFLRVA